MLQLSIIHQLSKRESVKTIDNIIQNIIIHANTFPDQTYLLADSAENREVLAAVKTIQTHFPNLIFIKTSTDTPAEHLVQELGLANSLGITNQNLISKEELQYLKRQLEQGIVKNLPRLFLHKEVALRAEKSFWKKLLLYLNYES